MIRNRQADKGKYAEAQARAWLDSTAAARGGFAYHRYPDARSARGALAAQPADFLVADRVLGTFHLEVKETKEQHRLPKAKIAQFGKLLMFQWAGITPYVLVYRSSRCDWTYFTPEDLFSPCGGEADTSLKSFPFAGRPTFPTAAAALESIFPIR